MSAESFVARCLVDPGYLAGLAGAEPGPDHPDLARVRLFGGLITKVQNNDFWDDLPYTRAALKLIGCELALFADYRDHHLLLRASRPTRSQRIAAFLAYVPLWLAEHQPEGSGQTLAISRHEQMLWQTRLELEQEAPSRPGGSRPLLVDGQLPAGAGRVRPRGVVRVAALEHHPSTLIAAIRRSQPLSAVQPQPTYVCYWGRPLVEEIRVLEVDAVTAEVLALTGSGSGGAARAELRTRLAARYPELPASAADQVVDAAVARGLLEEVPSCA